MQAPALVISEGYATAGSLSQSLGFATIAAFDAGNLVHVAKALHQKFPDKPIIIADDDDWHLVLTHDVNTGKIKAQEAAAATGGHLLLPIFAPGEGSYLADHTPHHAGTLPRPWSHRLGAEQDRARGARTNEAAYGFQ